MVTSIFNPGYGPVYDIDKYWKGYKNYDVSRANPIDDSQPSIAPSTVSTPPSKERQEAIQGAMKGALNVEQNKDKLNPNDVQQNTKGVDLYQSYLQHQKDKQKLMGMDPVKFDGYNKPTIPGPNKNKKGLTATQGANIISGVAGLASAGLGIYGAIRAAKDKPFVASYRAPVEPELIKDRTSAIKASTEESITKSVNTARAQQRSLGMSDYGALVGKETEALNQLAGQLAQYRTGIDAQNVQMANQMKMYNDQAERQRDLQNASLMNQFKQYTGQMLSAAYSGVGDSILGSANAIMQNVNYAQTKKEAEEAQMRQEKLYALISLADSPDLPTRTSAAAKLNSLYNI